MAAMTGCNSNYNEVKKAMDEPMKQERRFMDEAIRQHSPDVQRVDLIGNTVVYTHIFDGIVDVKTYTYEIGRASCRERVYI